MSETLPRLRMDLDFMSSPVPEHPGLMVRDPYHYSDATIVVPPELIPALEMFDGQSTELDLRQRLVEITGQFDVSELQQHLTKALSDGGFLQNEVYERMREARHREFAGAEVREAAHAGLAYPGDEEDLRALFDRFLEGGEPAANPGRLAGIAAPHVSPEGGWESYRDAYRALSAEHAERVFVILGTSHYGAPNRFGLTRKDFVTPYGRTRTETALVDLLASQAPEAVTMEDYCHASEHSIEFQVAFLQHLYGPRVRVLPILVGSFYPSIAGGGMPEDDEAVRRFLGALGDLNAARGGELMWVLGVDMAHIGRRYGDALPAQAYDGTMLPVSARDKERVARIAAGDSEGFWAEVGEGGGGEDQLKWCGSSPFYTFLKAVPEARGEMRRYQHWQIDPQSVVSFAALTFER
ncbi:MAG: AmmeMemoRadiSam system protein B [Bryobacteraceae bacterium]